ncbi:MAG: hypothetical protein AAGJ18_20760, partial [Bacteroidota bacterium]
SIFEEVLAQFSKKSEAVSVLSKLLQVGENAIYRRIRGVSVLTPNEMRTIAQHFSISLDALIHQQSDNILFGYPPANLRTKNFASYLNGLSQEMRPIIQSDEGQIKYAAAEIPLFHYCFFPEIIAFKLYTWGRTTWDFDYLQNRPFTFDLISRDAYAAANNLLQHYLQIDSVELWNLNILDNTLNQIEYYTESGGIANRRDALLLCEKMTILVQHLKAMATLGKKFPVDSKVVDNRKSFSLFHNEMVFTNNTIIVTTDAGKSVFSTLGNPNFIKGTDQRVVHTVEDWFHKIMSKSQPISAHAERARNKYFNRLLTKIQATQNRIMNL